MPRSIAAAKKKAAPSPFPPGWDGATPARNAQVRRLEAMARRLKKAAADVELAATYLDDGARQTCGAILEGGDGRRSVVSRLLSEVRNINKRRWEAPRS